MGGTTVGTATARLHNVLAKFEGVGEHQIRIDAPSCKLDDDWQVAQPSQAATSKASARQEVVVLVAGSMTLDIVASPHGKEIPQSGTTLPGKVSQQPGGVARNISYALSRLIPAQSLKLVSVVGKDAAGSALLRLWDNHNERSTSGILISASNRTATVATVMAGNEIYAGIADTGIVEEALPASWILRQVAESPACRLLLLDTNILERELRVVAHACRHRRIIVMVDPVSVPKSTRCLSLLQHIDIIKPGAAELQHMCNYVCENLHVPLIDPERSRKCCSLLTASQPVAPTVKHILSGLVVQCWILLRQGLGTVLLSLGAQGCAVCQMMHAKEARERVPLGLVAHSDSRASIVMVYCPSLPVNAVSTTGAGDCLVAGSIAGIVQGMAFGDAACIGIAAASKSCMSMDNVPSYLSWDSLAEDNEVLRPRTCSMLWFVDPRVLKRSVI